MARRKKKKSGLLGSLNRGSGDYYDYNLLVSILLLTTFGLIMLYSTSAYAASVRPGIEDDMFYFKKQAAISLVTMIGAVVISQIDYHIFARWSFTIYIVSNTLLVLTSLIGTELNGAKRWIFIGPISFQPAEFSKLAIILFIPYLVSKFGRKMRTWAGFWIILASGAVTSLFTFVFTDNLSTAIIIAGITVGILFIVFPKVWPFIAGAAGIAVVSTGVLIYALNQLNSNSSFRLQRIAVWLAPETYSRQGGYQVMQGLYAIGSGGFFGKGLGNSLQKLYYVPEAQNDMIFTIICEELGLFGAIMLTLIFVYMLYRLFFIAQNAPDLMGSLMVSGIFIHIALQVILNIAVVTNRIPTTGITLPFVSYGGTSVMFLMAEMAVALSVSRQIKFRE